MSAKVIEWTAQHERWARQAFRQHRLRAPGLDWQDMLQEARIGVWEAAQKADPDAASFHNFAVECARRRMRCALRTASRHKHQVLNQALSLHAPATPFGRVLLLDTIMDLRPGPEELVVLFERLAELARQRDEREQWDGRKGRAEALFAQGLDGHQIARELSVTERTVRRWLGGGRLDEARRSRWEHRRHAARRLRAEGASTAEIVAALGVGRSTVKRWTNTGVNIDMQEAA